MSIQSEAALEAGLIKTLQQMDYEYVQIAEEDNLQANFKRQLEIHNRKRLEEHGRTQFTNEEFENMAVLSLPTRNLKRYLSILKEEHALKKRKNSGISIRLTRQTANAFG